MANEQKLQALAQQLTQRTREGGVQWTAEGDTWFQLSLPSGAVSIHSQTADGTAPYQLSVYNDNGARVEALTSVWDQGNWGAEEKPWNAVLEELYGVARNSALNIDSVLDSILKDVEHPPADDDIPF
jgi:hypothetical protein